MQFVENKGQWEKQVNYKSEIPNGAFFLERNGFTVVMHKEDDMKALEEFFHGTGAEQNGKSSKDIKAKAMPGPLPQAGGGVTVHSHAYKVNFLNASQHAEAMPDKVLPTYNNYFYGKDPSKWKAECKVFQAVTYRNVYPNIDVRYYTDQGTLKYDIIVHPGGRVEDIALKYDGVDKLSIRNKELIIGTSVGEVKELYPYTYQVKDKGRETLDCKYVLDKNTVRFKVSNYDPASTIVIDPTVIFCSFTGSTKDNWGYTATPGPDGSFFAGGIVFGEGFPVSPGAFQNTWGNGAQEDDNGPYDIAIIKLSADGSKRLYATYLGGSGNEQPHSMICDAQGNLVVAGRTSSSNYPTRAGLVGSGGMYDIVVTKFNTTGTNLLGSIKVGGSGDDGINIRPKYVALPGGKQGAYDTRRNYGDDARGEVILDGGNNIYVASSTHSANFPVRNSTIQTNFGGGGQEIAQDGVIMKIDANLNNVLFSTFFGGSGNDACFVLSLSPLTGNLYVAGGTTSANLPGDKSGVLSGSAHGDVDGFVTSLRPDGSALIKTTYIGTAGADVVYGVQFDKFGFPYIMGTTTGTWTAINAPFNNAGGKQYIGKLKPDLSGYIYSTMFGTNTSSPNISPIAFLVDRCQNVYVSGWGGRFNNDRGYPCAGTGGLDFLITPNAVQSQGDGNDFFFFVLERDAQSELFGSYYGQYGGFADHVDGGTSRFDVNGIIYQAICANCANQPGEFFPTTPGVWAGNNPTRSCNEALLKIEMNFAGVGASVKATINGVFDTVGCVPLTVRFIDTLAKGKRYIWHYGDGTSPDTTLAPNNSVSHTYNNVGTYRLMLVSIDSATCNIADTAYASIRVGNNEVTPNFTAVKIGGCQSYTFQFTNTTTAVIPVYTPNSFLWDFGDGSTPQRAGLNTVTHTYASPGTYNVKLTVDDSVFCNAPDTITKQVRLAVNVKAQFTTPDRGCQPYTAQFANTSLGGTDFVWDFGDGSPTSAEIDPTHLYPNTGTYTVKLTAIDTTTCNRTDATTFNITVYPVPNAEFDFSPKPGDINKPINFTNQSIGAVSYLWDFNDGETSTLANPGHLFNETKTFDVCLIATNAAGCSDTICKPVEARVTPLLDVPNAFTPGKGGTISTIGVRGFGIGKMSWRIYNRWGQLMFESSSVKSTWDGTYKGAIQPQDVYTYTLDVEFTDGKKLRKTGDITLLR